MSASDGALVCPNCHARLKLGRSSTNAQPKVPTAQLKAPVTQDTVHSVPSNSLHYPLDNDPFGQLPFEQPVSNSGTDMYAAWGQSVQQLSSGMSPTSAATIQRPNSKPPKDPLKKLVLLGIAGGGAGLLLLVLLMVLLFRGLFSGTNAATDAATLTASTSPTTLLAVFDPKPYRPMPGPLPDPARTIPGDSWPVRLDANPADLSQAVGVILSHGKYLLANQHGPFAVGHSNPPGFVFLGVKDNRVYDSPEILAALTPYDVIDLRTGKSTSQFMVPFIRPQDHLSPDGKRLLTSEILDGKYTDYLLVYQVNNPEPIMKWKMQPNGVRLINFAGNDRVVVSQAAGTVITVIVLNIENSQVVGQSEIEDSSANVLGDLKIAVSPDGKYFSFVRGTGVWVYSATDGRKILELTNLEVNRQFLNRDRSVNSLPKFVDLQYDATGRFLHLFQSLESNTRDGIIGEAQCLATWDMRNGQLQSVCVLPYQRADLGNFCEGPEDGTLIVGSMVIDTNMGIPIAKCQEGIVAKLGPNQYLARTSLSEASNADALRNLSQANVQQVIGRVEIPAAEFAKAAAQARAKDLARIAADTKALPRVDMMDRSAIQAISLNEKPAWLVVPRQERTPIPADWQLPRLPRLTGLTEGADVDSGYRWTRFDLSTGKPLSDPIRLDPRYGEIYQGIVHAPSQALPRAALTKDARRLAVDVYEDMKQVDVWDSSGKRITGFRPYGLSAVEPNFQWSDDGLLITSNKSKITAWDVTARKGVYEINCQYEAWQMVPFMNWLVIATKAGSLEFLDAENGHHLGRLPWSGGVPSISPDGKTCYRNFARNDGNVQTPPNMFWVEVWDLSTGSMSMIPEAPKGLLNGCWLNNRRLLSKSIYSDRPSLLYDFDLHTHTHDYTFPKYCDYQIDSLGRSWMTDPDPKGDVSQKIYKALQLSNDGKLVGEFVLGLNKSISIKVDIDHSELSPKIELALSKVLRDRGMVIGPGGCELKVWHTEGVYKDRLWNQQKSEEVDLKFPLHNFHWKLTAPDGVMLWQTVTAVQFSPFNSKYRTTPGYKERTKTTYDGRALEEAKLDYKGRNPTLCQIEELIEDRTVLLLGYIPTEFPEYVLKTSGAYTVLPIPVSLDAK